MMRGSRFTGCPSRGAQAADQGDRGVGESTPYRKIPLRQELFELFCVLFALLSKTGAVVGLVLVPLKLLSPEMSTYSWW